MSMLVNISICMQVSHAKFYAVYSPCWMTSTSESDKPRLCHYEQYFGDTFLENKAGRLAWVGKMRLAHLQPNVTRQAVPGTALLQQLFPLTMWTLMQRGMTSSLLSWTINCKSSLSAGGEVIAGCISIYLPSR